MVPAWDPNVKHSPSSETGLVKDTTALLFVGASGSSSRSTAPEVTSVMWLYFIIRDLVTKYVKVSAVGRTQQRQRSTVMSCRTNRQLSKGIIFIIITAAVGLVLDNFCYRDRNRLHHHRPHSQPWVWIFLLFFFSAGKLFFLHPHLHEYSEGKSSGSNVHSHTQSSFKLWATVSSQRNNLTFWKIRNKT